jgi:hypothetical protein
MKRNPRHRLLAALLTFVSLIVGAMLPISVANAAPTNCTTGDGTLCFLDISAPQSVVTGQPFIVQVAVTTDESRTVVAKSDPCSRVTVTLVVSLSDDPVTYTANTAGGIATFNVVVTTSGFYSLDATASKTGCSYADDFATFEAVTVDANQPIAPCPADVACTQVTSGGTGSAATLFADSNGRFTAFFSPFDAAEGCGNLSPADPTNGVLTFVLNDPSASKTVIFALSSDLITNGIGRYNICWRSPNEFTQLGGTQAPAVGPSICGQDGASACFTGLLPNCKNDDVGPCVLFRTSGQHNVGFFGILAPPGDPQAYPGV